MFSDQRFIDVGDGSKHHQHINKIGNDINMSLMRKKCHSWQRKCKQHSNNCSINTFQPNYIEHSDQQQRQQQQQDSISQNIFIIEFCKKVFRKCFFFLTTHDGNVSVKCEERVFFYFFSSD